MQNPTPRIPEYDLVAEICKTKGLDGQLVAQELGRLSVLRPGLEVWIVPPTLNGVRQTMVTEAIEDFKKRGVLIRLKGVEDRTQATELIGRSLLARLEQRNAAVMIDDDEDEGLYREATSIAPHQRGNPGAVSVGTHFVDTTYGDLGILEDIKAGPAYEVWVISGSYGILEIPAVDAYVASAISVAAETAAAAADGRALRLALPKGFIEMTGAARREN
ncbi:MAG: hypothetical protein FWD27_09030 [Coriobacteriia bacterium]|nr:hypothetical protein [Coriobacteriia bacterium]